MIPASKQKNCWSVLTAGLLLFATSAYASDLCKALGTCNSVPDLAPVISRPCEAIGTCIEIVHFPTLSEITNAVCAKPFQAYATTVYNQCVNDNDGANSIFTSSRNVQLAAAILTDMGIYSRSDFEGVTVTFCGAISGGYAAGMVPSPGQILLERDLKNTPPLNDAWAYDNSSDPSGGGITATLAHEMVHIKQIRNNGYDGFACGYSGEMLKHGGSGEGNTFEKEAYDKARQVNNLLKGYVRTKADDQLINDFLHPPAPPVPPIQAQINGALTAINALLYDTPSCKYTLSQTNVRTPNTAGTYTVNVTTDASCDWKATSNVSWLSSSSSGKGNGVLDYKVTATDAYNNRTGTITLTSSNGGSQTLNVTQSPKIQTIQLPKAKQVR